MKYVLGVFVFAFVVLIAAIVVGAITSVWPVMVLAVLIALIAIMDK